ncbi:MAG: hypothetical protein HY291_15205 [Planctomycetes bacterium]|nr:hypothetical protein [Planctomycetota bacterium]
MSHEDVLPELRVPAPNLGNMPEAQLAQRLSADEKRLRVVLEALEKLKAQAAKFREDFAAGRRSFYSQADNDALRRILMTYLACRKALLGLICQYQGYADIPAEALRLRAFLAGYAAATALWAHSLSLIKDFGKKSETVKKLNEAEPLWDIPADLYDTLRRNLSRPGNRKLMEDAHLYYRDQADGFKRYKLVAGPPYAAFHASIKRSVDTTQNLSEREWKERAAVRLRSVRRRASNALYRAQSVVTYWIGGLKVYDPRDGKGLIQMEHLDALRERLEPGDILLERHNWYASNAFLPGYWPHAALYVGTADDLAGLGVERDPRVRKHWKQFAAPDAAGHRRAIIEALGEGVVSASLEESAGTGDAFAAFRPRLPKAKIKEAICRGFSHIGKPYDFEFDFFSTDKIVCTELVFRAYDGEIHFPLVEVMGRKTLPAIEMVRKFDQDRKAGKPQLEFVVFLDGDEKTGACRFCDESELVETLARPGMTWLQGLHKKRHGGA